MTSKVSEQMKAEGLYKNFGAVSVLIDINFSMFSHEAIGIVGPNGAGKTTFLSALAGSLVPSAGIITMADKDVTHVGATERCKMGIVRSHQVPKPFEGMTVFENVHTAASHGNDCTAKQAIDNALYAVDLCGMSGLANRHAGSLGLLDRKRLEVARALATQPRFLLLDEIAGGLTDAEAGELIIAIQHLRSQNIGIIWIEHIVHVLLQVAERLICMDSGRIIADGDPDSVLADESVVTAYFGSAMA